MGKVLLLLLISFASRAQPPIPEHGGYWVHDEAHILSAQTKSELEKALKEERDTTSNQIAVLTIPSLEGDDIANYAVKVFEKWKLGQTKKDNGVLFVIAPNNRKVRIEVGYGLEGILTDAVASRIIRNEVAPFFKSNNFEAGVKAGTISIIQAIEGEYKQDSSSSLFHLSPLIISIIIILIFILLSRHGGGRSGGFRRGVGPIIMAGGFLPSGGGSWGGGGSSWGGGGMSGGGGASGSW